MERYGNIRFNRRVVSFVCMLVMAVLVLMPLQIVRADTVSKNGNLSFYGFMANEDLLEETDRNAKFVDELKLSGSSPIYSFIIFPSTPYESSKGHSVYDFIYGYVSVSDFAVKGSCHFTADRGFDYDGPHLAYNTDSVSYGILSSSVCSLYADYQRVRMYSINPRRISADIVIGCDTFNSDKSYRDNYNKSMADALGKLQNYVKNGVVSDKMMLNVGQGYQAQDKAYSEIGCLDNVQMETYVTNKKELIDADENADLSKINQDKVIVYSSTSTTGIDLSRGGYKVQLYGSYAWQDKSGNIKSEDKGHKTFIKDWKAENNIKGLNRSAYTWIDWKSANDKVEANRTSNAHKPNAFEKMTTYANYQYEPIWYLRIVSQDNKYGAWVKLYNSSTKKGNYDSDSVDDDGNKVSDSDGGYDKTKSTSEITGTGDTPEDAKDNVQKAEEKQDNKDIQDASGGSNSTFDKLEEFTKGIGDVPKMIADIFSFLPSWCLEVVAIGFALLMILIVVKFIRG